MSGSNLRITPPSDYLLPRDVCSYGYFLLAPNRWDPCSQMLTRPLHVERGAVVCVIAQPGGSSGDAVRVRTDRRLDRVEQRQARGMIRRMLNLDDEGVRAFHRRDRRWRESGRGRLFRSPTLFEDVIKTVTSCNVSWPSTIRMNRRLCEVVEPTFPRPRQLGRRRAATLRARCGVGYRDRRIIELARLFAAGTDERVRTLGDPSATDDEVRAALLVLPGIGPYAAANIMQLLGRYGRLPIDTESIRHARTVLGWEGETPELTRRLEAHYERFGEHRFRSYWFELWADYERRKGPAWTWDPKTTADAFTAAKLNAEGRVGR